MSHTFVYNPDIFPVWPICKACTFFLF